MGPDRSTNGLDMLWGSLGKLVTACFCMPWVSVRKLMTACFNMLWESVGKLMTAYFYMLWGSVGKLIRACIYRVLSVGPIPDHFAFIMDGNRRYAKKHVINVWEAHQYGTLSCISVVMYLYELGVKYITVYTFSIDNFKRKPEQVQVVMKLLTEKTGEMLRQDSIVNVYGVRVVFIGNLNLLEKSIKEAAEKVMIATAKNTKSMLLICVAYNSTEEIVHAVREICKEKCASNIGVAKGYDKENQSIKLADLEKHFYMAVAPEPDILIRTSGETRLSNFLLWQTANCTLYNPAALWPEMGFYHIVRAIFKFQHNYVGKKLVWT